MLGNRVRTRIGVLAGLIALAAGAGTFVAAGPAQAASACEIDYDVDEIWGNGSSGQFTADINIKNLGDKIDSWTLYWFFTGGQHVTQVWEVKSWKQEGTKVTTESAPSNSVLESQASTGIRLLATWTGGTNPEPTRFVINDVVTCSVKP